MTDKISGQPFLFAGCGGSQTNDEPTDDRQPGGEKQEFGSLCNCLLSGFLWPWISLARWQPATAAAATRQPGDQPFLLKRLQLTGTGPSEE